MDAENQSFLEKHFYYIVLAVVGTVVYFNGLFGPFVWDDISQIQNNYLVHSILNIISFFFGGTFVPQNSSNLMGLYYRPLMTTMYSLIYTIFRQQTFFYHFFQLILHIINASLIFYLLKKYIKEPISFVLSLVFLVHPINTEAIVYIATLGDPLFFLFGIMALALFINGRASTKRWILIGALILLSLFSKETGILFGIIIMCYYWIFEEKSPKETVRTSLIFAIPLAIYILFRFVLAKVYLIKIPDVPMMTASFPERLLTMPAIFLFYVKTFLFPINLFIYQEWAVTKLNANFYIPLLIDSVILLALLLFGWWIRKTNKNNFKAFLFFAIWFLIGVGFHLQIVPLDMTVADHMFYFPIVGILGVIGVSIQNIKHYPNYLPRVGITFAIIISILLSVRIIIRNMDWSSGISLYSHDFQYQKNDRLENLLATELVAAGRLPEAQQHFEVLLETHPKEPALVVNLSMVYELEGDLSKAEETYKNGMQYDDSGVIYSNYVRVLIKEGKTNQAKMLCDQGLEKFPQNSTLWALNGIATYKLGDKQQALEDIQRAKDMSGDPRIDQIYQGIQDDNLIY